MPGGHHAQPPGGRGVRGGPVGPGERVECDDGGPLPTPQAVGGADGDAVDIPPERRAWTTEACALCDTTTATSDGPSGRDPASVVRVPPNRACARSATVASIAGWFGSPVAGTSSDSISRCPASAVAGRAELNLNPQI